MTVCGSSGACITGTGSDDHRFCVMMSMMFSMILYCSIRSDGRWPERGEVLFQERRASAAK